MALSTLRICAECTTIPPTRSDPCARCSKLKPFAHGICRLDAKIIHPIRDRRFNAGMIGSLASKSFYVHQSRVKRLMQQKACHDGMQDSPRKNGPILGHLGKPGSPIEE